jgi:hypothetical protein
MFSTGKADQLGVAILVVLITYQTKPFEISGIHPEIHPLTPDDFDWGRAGKILVKYPLKGIFRKATIAAKNLKSLPFKHPLLKPYKTVPKGLFFGVSGEKNAAIFTFEPLFSCLFPPADYFQTSASPTPVFFSFSYTKKVY